MEAVYYIERCARLPGCFNMRQTRYRADYVNGMEHPHDLMAVGFTADQMRELIAKHFPNTVIDTSVMA